MGIKGTNKIKNPEKYTVCAHCPHYKSVAEYEIEVKAYGAEKAYECKYEFICERIYNLMKIQ